MVPAVTDGLARSEEQRQLITLARDFATREVRPAARAVDAAATESPLLCGARRAGSG